MKINVKLLISLALALGFLAFSAKAQDTPMVGGYSKISTRSAEAQKAARFAVASRSVTYRNIVLLNVLKAEQQVVAGMNYRLCMRVSERGRKRTVTVVVYRNLRNRWSLTSWETGGCG